VAIGIGEALRAARERQGRSLDEASRATRVRVEYLSALEEEDFDRIGGDVYAKGFLTSYARFLGLDPAPLLDLYRAQVRGTEHSPRELLEVPVRTRQGIPRWVVWTATGVLVLGATLTLANALGGRAPEPAAEPTATTTPSPTPVRPSARPSTATPIAPTTAAATGGVHLVVLVEAACWIEAFTDGSAAFASRTFQAGEAIEIDALEEIVISLGNTAGVSLVLNGRDLGSLGGDGVVQDGRCTASGCDFEADA